MAQLDNYPQHWLRDDAAAAFNRAEREHGRFGVTSAGRTEAEQQHLIGRWDRGGKQNRPPFLYPPARPAKTSPHVANGGTAVDVSQHVRFAAVAARYGFTRPIPSDPVHFVFVGLPQAPAPAPAPQPNAAGRPTVRRGSKGGHVAHLQRTLNARYPAYSKLATDGDFGPGTERTVKEFQRRAGLTADGIVGPATWGRLGG